MVQADFARMQDIEDRYRLLSGLHDRRDYSVFYGPLAPFPLAMINENPGGSADNYRIVRVEAGEHEYVEGRHSGRTTHNGAELLRRLLDAESFEPVRQIQVFNRLFRRSPHSGVFSTQQKAAYAEEARPFLLECLQLVSPRLIIFGGANAAIPFMDGIGGRALADFKSTIMGPNGRCEAVYYREFALSHPLLGELAGIGIYHPSKLNTFFYDRVFPRLKQRIAACL